MSDFQNTDHLDLELDRGWLTVWFNSPENRNALSAESTAELIEVLDRAAADPGLRGLTLRGRHGVFCSGGDLKSFQTGLQGDGDPAAVAEASKGAARLFDAVENFPQPVIVLVEGAAMAGGLGVACCADIVLVEDGARFSLTETTLGIPPAQIAPFVVRRIGLPAARRLMLTAARFKGAEALKLGLADFTAQDAAGLEAIEADIRAQVRRCAPGANAVTKRLVLAAPHLKREAMIEAAAKGFADCLLGEEAREGISAFVEKRKPRWAEED